MFAWAFHNGQFSFTQAAGKCKAAGYEWAVLELDDETTGAYNRAHWPDFKAAFQGLDMKAGTWVTEGGNMGMTPPDADLAIAECEGPGDYTGILTAEAAGSVPKVPKAICTNFNVPLTTPAGAPDRAAAKPLIDAGYFCLTEAYMGDNPAATPDNLNLMAQKLGWPRSQPVFGVYNAPPSTYAPWAAWPGADYLGEYVL